MGIPVYQLDSNRVTNYRRLFPDATETDDWAIFHGTSGSNAECIERNGFDSTYGAISSAQIQRVTAVFERMKWCGDDLGGYAILKPFSYNHDFQGSDRSLLFFAETSMWALLYATRDFAGGEKLRALRRAFRDLESYLNDPRVGELHCGSLKAKFNHLSALNASPADIEAARPVKIDSAWLRQELTDLSDVRMIAEDAYRRHDHGVVYALSTTQDDVENLYLNNFMGIEAGIRIPPSTIVGKVIVPADYETDQPGRTVDDLDRQHRGLFAALSTRDGQRKS